MKYNVKSDLLANKKPTDTAAAKHLMAGYVRQKLS
jgi:hypothetical protein